MKLLMILCLAAMALADDKYTDKYDNIDLEEILSNRRLLTSYANCVLDKGRCNAEGKELRNNLEDALATGCSKCTERQQNGTYITIEHLIKHEPELWREVTDKFDPDKKYRKKYEDLAREKGIEIPE